MKKKRSFFTPVFVIICVLFFKHYASACSCATLPINYQIESPNIVILKLQSVEKYKNGEANYAVGNIKQSKLIVEKVFKGNFKTGQELDFEQGGGADCIWAFDEKSIGTEYLFFLDKNNFSEGLWRGAVCSRSGQVKESGADLLYVKNGKRNLGKTRLSGMLNRVIESSDKKGWNYTPLAGKTVRILGKGVDVTLKTDENGAYEIYNLPVGKYKIIPQEIRKYRILAPYNDNSEITIEPNSLVEQNFEYLIK